MKAFYLKQGEWKETENLFEVFSLNEKLKKRKERAYVIAVVGAGGKTSGIYRLAAEGVKKGKRVLILTTTHMFCPSQFGIFSEEIEKVEKLLREKSIAIVGKKAGEEKMSFVGEEFYKKLLKIADLVLVEADGSRHHPIKVPATHEPVIPTGTDEILCLCGLSCLGRGAREVCFRLEQALAFREIYRLSSEEKKEEWKIEKQDIINLMSKGYLIPMREQNRGSKVTLMLMQADENKLEKIGKKIIEEMGEEGVLVGDLPILSQYRPI